MKFIVDAQLPKSLSILLCSKGFDSVHTLNLASGNSTTDAEILRFSEAEDRIVITKDSDFLQSYLLNNRPKKLILVRTGNITNNQLLNLFDRNMALIITALSGSNLLEVTRNEIIEHK